MKLKALDQVHISAVQADTLQPGQVFEVSDAHGAELIKAHPAKFEEVAADAAQPDPEPQPAEEKAAPIPDNKAAPEPANKAAPKKRAK